MNTELHDQHTLESVVSTASNCRRMFHCTLAIDSSLTFFAVFTDVQRFGLFSKVSKAVAFKGGKLSCPLPDISDQSTTHLEDGFVYDEEALSATMSSVSIHSGHNQHALGYGNALGMRQNSMGYNGAVPFGNVHRPDFTGITSSQLMNTSTTLGFPVASVNRSVPLGATSQAPYDVLAREFNVEPDLIAALAQRLAFSGQAISPRTIGAFAYANGGM